MANTRYAYTTATLAEVFKENQSGVINLTGNPLKIASATASGAGRADSKHGLSSITPFTTGCGVYRFKLSTWVDDSSGATHAIHQDLNLDYVIQHRINGDCLIRCLMTIKTYAIKRIPTRD